MKAIIFGGAGMLGSAIAKALRSHGHEVITAGRSGCDVHVDFCDASHIDDFLPLLQGVDIVVNAVGILIERKGAGAGDSFDAVHVAAPKALFEACAKAHVARVVQISALGAGRGTRGRHIASKEAAEAALAEAMTHASGDWTIVRPSLLIHAGSLATELFTRLARSPIIGLPGLLHPGSARLSPMLCEDAAAALCRICEHPKALRRVIELAGVEELSYRAFLTELRAAQGYSHALWLPIPWLLMRWLAKLAEFFPQKVVSADGMRILKAGITTEHNEALYWLRCMPKPVVAGIFTVQSAIKLEVSKEASI